MGQASCKTGPVVFLCHAGEDKDRFVEPLNKALIEKGLKADDIFYDKVNIEAGHQIKPSIESAIDNPNLQLVVKVLSRKLLCEHKYWPKRELEMAQQKGKKIFPVWLDHDFENFDTLVRKYSPTLKGIRAHRVTCDRQTGSVNDGKIRAVAATIIRKLEKTAKRRNTGYNVLAMVAAIVLVIAVLFKFYPITTKDDPDISKTASFLKVLYSRRYSYIQPLPWKPGLRVGLVDGYINPRMQREDDRGLFNAPTEVVTTTELLNSHEKSHKGNDVKQNRIIVEAEPGGGKSTLCRKVVMDWVGGRVTSFTLIFLIELRRFDGSVLNSMYDQLLGDNIDISKNALKEYIRHHQENVCFILDGFDELNLEYQKKSEIIDLIKGKIFHGSTVLVTSRPSRLREVVKDSDAFYKIVGFREDQKRKIFQTYFMNDSMSADELSQTVSSNHYLNEITENPLNALLICVLWEDNRRRLPETKTQLYVEIVKSITRRYCDKLVIECDGKSFPANVEMLLLSQGKVAWKGSEIDKRDFDIADMKAENNKTAEILSLGMMVQRETDSRTSGYTYMAFLHPTLQEFMAAYYIRSMLYKEDDLITEILNTIMQRENLEGVLIFLCGLSGEQARPLLKAFNDAIDTNVTTTKSLVRRCLVCLGATNVAAGLADTIAPAMPEEVVLDFDYLSDEWTDGFIAFVQFLQMSSDDTLQKTFRSLVLASIHRAPGMNSDMLIRIRSVLKASTVVESLEITGWAILTSSIADNTVLRSPLSDFSPDETLKKVDITVHSAKNCSTIKRMTLSDILEDLRKKRNLNEINIFVFSASATSYCDAISLLLQSQTSLKSFALNVTTFHHDTQGCQDFRVMLDVIKDHNSLRSVSLKQPAKAILSESSLAHNASNLLISIAQFIRENRILTSFDFRIWNCSSPCSRFALMELSEAIRSNHILEALTIVGIRLENESDQKVVEDIMGNKPSTMRTLELRMNTLSGLFGDFF